MGTPTKATKIAKQDRALESIGACHESRNWLLKKKLLIGDAWKTCRRGDWMLWLLGYVGATWEIGSPKHRHLTGCVVEILLTTVLPVRCASGEGECWDATNRTIEFLAKYADGAQDDPCQHPHAQRLAYTEGVYETSCAWGMLMVPRICTRERAMSGTQASRIYTNDDNGWTNIREGVPSPTDVVVAKIVRKWFPSCPKIPTA